VIATGSLIDPDGTLIFTAPSIVAIVAVCPGAGGCTTYTAPVSIRNLIGSVRPLTSAMSVPVVVFLAALPVLYSVHRHSRAPSSRRARARDT
jgi:hypothetical protein